KLERFQADAGQRQLVHRLRSLKALARNPGTEAIWLLAGVEADILRPHRDLDVFTRGNARRKPYDEAKAGVRLDRAKVAVAGNDASRQEDGRPGKTRHEEISRPVVDLGGRRHLEE